MTDRKKTVIHGFAYSSREAAAREFGFSTGGTNKNAKRWGMTFEQALERQLTNPSPMRVAQKCKGVEKPCHPLMRDWLRKALI